jgi:hypothetical protein
VLQYLQPYWLLSILQRLVIWGSTTYVAKDDIKIWERTRDSSYWNQQIRAKAQSIYGDSFEWFRYIDIVNLRRSTRRERMVPVVCVWMSTVSNADSARSKGQAVSSISRRLSQGEH